MKRRTMMRKLGAAGIATAAISGTATAKRVTVADVGIDREIDVSSTEGWVTLEELLEPEELAALPRGVDRTERIGVHPAADTITLGDNCCAICCEEVLDPPSCDCTYCDDDACTDGSVP